MSDQAYVALGTEAGPAGRLPMRLLRLYGLARSLRLYWANPFQLRRLRRFYAESRFTKVGTNDFQRAMEAESGRSLDRFFEQWIFGSSLPRLSFRYQVQVADEGREVVLRLEQVGEVFDLPVTVTLEYANGTSADVVVPLTEQVVEHRVRLDAPLKTARISRDDGTLANVIED